MSSQANPVVSMQVMDDTQLLFVRADGSVWLTQLWLHLINEKGARMAPEVGSWVKVGHVPNPAT